MKKLVGIQNELKCNKSQHNKFGNYYFRSCEDILESVKPLLKKYGCTLVLGDDIVQVGERYYVKATATLTDTETGEKEINSALARESADKKGMDDSQITGTASSYARKYALNGLFAIDDTKDADTNEYANITKKDTISAEQEAELRGLAEKKNTDEVLIILSQYGYKKLKEVMTKDFEKIKKDLEG